VRSRIVNSQWRREVVNAQSPRSRGSPRRQRHNRSQQQTQCDPLHPYPLHSSALFSKKRVDRKLQAPNHRIPVHRIGICPIQIKSFAALVLVPALKETSSWRPGLRKTSSNEISYKRNNLIQARMPLSIAFQPGKITRYALN
jgi:hypothetical protein